MGKRRFMGEAWGYNNDGSSTTSASRLGSMGIKTHTRGWDLGIEVQGQVTVDGTDRDVFFIYVTGGSNDDSQKELVCMVRATEDGSYQIGDVM
jgi:hypothetical protein